MGYFDFKKTVAGNYLDRRNPPYRAATAGLASKQSLANFDQSRFNPQKDRLEEGSIIEDWIPRQPTNLHLLFRKIYLRDAISGSVVDIFSSLPWGKIYELIGIDDPKVMQMYHDMLEALEIWNDLSMISRELLIIGRMVGSMVFNEQKGLWDSLVPIDPDQARLTPIPTDTKPLVDVLSSPAWREFSRSTDPRLVEVKEKLPKNILELLQNTSGYLPLDPLNTLFLARRVNQYDKIGTSLYTRVLPAWAYETALWNASLTGVRRRNRSILLLTAGIQDQWEPNDDELGALTQLFMQADEDPTGAVIAVRQGVDASEIRDPSSIWGISQEYDFLTTLKMRALGVSEAYLSGEVNVSTMEAARTSLGKQLATFRDMVLTEIFQRQLFPTFARIHNFQKRTKAELDHGIRLTPGSRADREAEYERRMRENDRLSQWGFPVVSAKMSLDIPTEALLMPRLITEDTLRPEQDVAYLEMLDKIAEKGVPVPLRIWASAAGYDLDKAMAMMEEDAVLKKRMAQLATNSEQGGVPAGGGGGGGGEEDLFGGGGQDEAGVGRTATIPPKWDFTGVQKLDRVKPMNNFRQIEANFESNPYHKIYAKINPRYLSELNVPSDRILVPYQPTEQIMHKKKS